MTRELHTVDVQRLLELSQQEIDALFRSSAAGEIPDGEVSGTFLLARGEELSEVAARVVHYVAWQGKVFDRERGELWNRVTPFGVRALRAKVFKDPSWFDGKECIAIDYSHTSLIAQWVRDEIREVAPGLYLGFLFWDHERLLNFALRVAPASPSSAAEPVWR